MKRSSKTSGIKERRVLIPVLMLCVLSMLLVVIVINLPGRQIVFVEASQQISLSSQDDSQSLENDLLLLKADHTVTELEILDQIDR